MKKVSAQSLFFPAACIQAAIVVLLTLIAYRIPSSGLSAFVGFGHAHEMLFGFSLALIAGYTLGQIESLWLNGLFALWLLARVSYWVAPSSVIAQWASPLFALLLAWKIVPRFFAAKKWRNRMISPLLLAICSVPLGALLVNKLGWAVGQRQLTLAFILLLIMLMAFIGGRIIAPAAAGELLKQGITLQARVQPRIEALILLLLPAGALSALIPGASQVAGVFTIGVGLLLTVRLLRWQIWRCANRVDLIGLGIGYGWLAIGSFGLGMAMLFKLPNQSLLHLITVGAIGSLSASVMLKSRLHHFKQQPQPRLMMMNILGLLCIATVLRVLAGAMPAPSLLTLGSNMLWLSAISWSAAYLALSIFLISTYQYPLVKGKGAGSHKALRPLPSTRGHCHDSI